MNSVTRLLKLWTARGPDGSSAVTPAPLLMPLEPRIVYDASVAAIGLAAAHHQPNVVERSAEHGRVSESAGLPLAARVFRAPAEHGSPVARRGGEPPSIRPELVAPRQSLTSGRDTALRNPVRNTAVHNTSLRDTGVRNTAGTGQVVFVDPGVTDYQELLVGLPSGTSVVVLNSSTDGLQQIAQYLDAHSGVTAIHLIAHGSEGEVHFGSTVLDAANVSAYQGELAQIGAAMRPGGDFLIYGCDVAEGRDGQGLVQGIAAYTHLNVAASTTLVGATARGGHWTLNYDVGNVHTPVIFSAAAEQGYGYLFTQIDETYDAYANGGAGQTIATNVTSFTLDNITYSTNVAATTTVSTQNQSVPLSTSASDGVLFVNQPGTSAVNELTITMADGDPMIVTSFDFDAGLSNGTIYLIPDGNTGKELQLTHAQMTNAHLDLSTNANFKGITSLEILDSGDTGNFTPALNNFTYTDLSSPPVLTASGGTTAFVEGNNVAHVPSTPVAIDSGIRLVDGDSGTAVSGTVSITGNFHSGEDVLAFSNTNAVTYGNISATYSAGTLTLTSSGGSATIAQWQAAFEAVTYNDTAVAPNTATRTIAFTLNDGLGDAGQSNTVTKSVSVARTDQVPIVTTTGGTVNYEATSSAVFIDSGVTVTDSDNTTQASATVSISSGFHSGDVLLFTNNGTTMGNITGSYSAGVLTLTSSSASATDAQWSSALDAVKFSSTSTTYGNRTISFTVNDGTSNSPTATDTVDVTAPPTITTDSGSAAFVAGDNVTSTPVAIDSGITVADTSISTLQSATVAITGGTFVNGEDALAFTNNGTTMGNITGSYNSSIGQLILTSSGATATVSQWQAALQAVTYTDSAITPNNATRTVSFSATDANGVTSNTATRTVTVADTDQTPVVATRGGTTANYVGGTAAVTIDSGVTVTDRDNTTQATGSVSISSGFQNGDSLSFTNNGTTMGNISGSYSAGVLTLTSASDSATNAQWAAALSAVTFSSSSTTYGNRTISFAVNDGTKTSVAATDTVDMLSPPEITTDSGSAAFVAADNSASTPVAIDAGVTLADPGSPTIIQARIVLTGNFQSSEDLLAFTNTNSATFGNIARDSVNSSNGTLVLGSAGNTATLAQWQAALQAVTYTDTAITPNSATRTVSFAVVDGNGNQSNSATRTVTIADTDQTPIVVTTGGATSYVAGTAAATIDGGVSVTDRDNTTQASGTVLISSGFHSGDVLAFTNDGTTMGNIVGSYNSGTGMLTLTSSGASATDAQWASAMQAVAFSSGASATPGNRTISFAVNDGTKTSTAATDTVDVQAPPQITTDSGSAAFVAGDNVASTPVAIDSGLTLTDGSSSTLGSATVAVTGNFRSGEDVLAFTNNGTTMGNIASSYDGTTGVLTLTSSGASATLSQWQNALEAVSYTDTAITPNNATRTVSFTVVDGGGTTSNTATRTVTVTDTDQTPIVTTTGGTTNYVGGTSAVAIDGGVSVIDHDNTTQASGTVSISSGFQSGDVLAFTNNAATMGNISGSYDSSTGVLTLTSAGATATDAQWTSALEAVSFSSGASATPGNRTISFTVNDGTKTSTAATDTVDVQAPPQVTTDSGSAAFVAGDNVASTPVAIDSGLTLTDGSSSTLGSAAVAVTGNFHSGEDVLAFTNNGTTMGNIAGSYDATTGVLTLSSSGASATLTQWQNALEAVTYTDTAITPNNATRTISFTVVDGGGTTSNTAMRTVTVTDTDQTPIVTTTGGTTNYVAGTSAAAIDGGVSVTDHDNTTQASGAVSISGGFQSGDVLAFANNGITMGNIAGSYNASTGVLTLTSSGATATDAQWTSALEAVSFSSGASATPANRTISFAVNDGTKSSAVSTKVVDVVGPPLVTSDPGSAAFVAGDNVASTPVAIDSGFAISDAGSGTLASATVSITGNLHSGEDVLAFTNNGTTMGNVAGSYDASTGVLSLTSSGATATLAQWQAALQAVTYTDTAVTPSNATRTISFSVIDGNGSSSNVATRTVTVTDTDQTPIVTVTGGTTLSYVGGGSAAAIDGGIVVSDRDNATQASATVSIGNGFSSGDTLAFTNSSSTLFGNIGASYNPGTGVLTLASSGATATDAQWSHALSAVTFSAAANVTPGNRTISFAVSDGSKISAVATDSVRVGAPPLVTTDAGAAAFVAGDNTTSTPVAVDSGLAITDASSGTLASATVAINNFVGGEDQLIFSNDGVTMGNIAGSYSAGTGTLSLTSSGSSATLAQWRAALNSILYTDSAVTPTNTTRTISFEVTDANAAVSNLASRTVTVTDTDQTPIVTATGGSTRYVDGSSAANVDSGITVSDRDNPTLTSGSVAITSGFQSGDVLAFTNTSSATFGNIAASYDATRGVLTLTSAGATATDAQWQSALDAVGFSTGANVVPGGRTVSFMVSDGTKTSLAATKTVNGIGPPSITSDSGSASFVAGDNVASTPVMVDAGIGLLDPGSTALASATVSITGNFHSGEDVLAFKNVGAAAMGNITASYDANTGVMNLTSAGATATLAQWEAALQAVTYTDTAITPNSAARTISFSVVDAAGNGSNVATRSVTIRDTDQTPLLSTTAGSSTANYIPGLTSVVVDSGITVSDRGTAALASATVSISAGFQPGDQLSFTPGSNSVYGNIASSYDSATGVLTLESAGGTATLAQWQSALDAIRFSSPADAAPGNRTISFVVSDGVQASLAATTSVDLVAPAFAPPVVAGATSAQEGSGGAIVALSPGGSEPLIVLTELDPKVVSDFGPNVMTALYSAAALDGGLLGISSDGARTETGIDISGWLLPMSRWSGTTMHRDVAKDSGTLPAHAVKAGQRLQSHSSQPTSKPSAPVSKPSLAQQFARQRRTLHVPSHPAALRSNRSA